MSVPHNLADVHTALKRLGVWHKYEWQGEGFDTVEAVELLDLLANGSWWYRAFSIDHCTVFGACRYQRREDGGGYEKIECGSPAEFLEMVEEMLEMKYREERA